MKALSEAERESLVAKVVTSGLFDKAEASEMDDEELVAMSELLDSPDTLLDPDTGYMDSDDLSDSEKMRRELQEAATEPQSLPKESDFPPGTVFVVKGFDPYAVFPGDGSISERVFSFSSGKKPKSPSRSVNLAGSGWPKSMPFAEWLEAVREAAAD